MIFTPSQRSVLFPFYRQEKKGSARLNGQAGVTKQGQVELIHISSDADLVFCSLHFHSETLVPINYKMLDRAEPMPAFFIATYALFSNVPEYNRCSVNISCMNVE